MGPLGIVVQMQGNLDGLPVNDEVNNQVTIASIDGVSSGVQIIGTGAHEVLAISADLGSGGWAFFRNLDDTHQVEIGTDSAGTFMSFSELFPGNGFAVPLKSKNVYAKATGGNVRLFYKILPR